MHRRFATKGNQQPFNTLEETGSDRKGVKQEKSRGTDSVEGSGVEVVVKPVRNPYRAPRRAPPACRTCARACACRATTAALKPQSMRLLGNPELFEQFVKSQVFSAHEHHMAASPLRPQSVTSLPTARLCQRVVRRSCMNLASLVGRRFVSLASQLRVCTTALIRSIARLANCLPSRSTHTALQRVPESDTLRCPMRKSKHGLFAS